MDGQGVKQGECHIELESFADLARLACSYTSRPKRVYSFMLGDDRVASTILTMANTVAVLYAPLPKDGGYISYKIDAGKEYYDVVDTASSTTSSAPIIHLMSNITLLDVAKSSDEIPDTFDPVELRDVGSLARLTYDPDFPEDSDLTLYAIPVDGAWVLGRPLLFGMDELYHAFYHVRVDSEPASPFLRYGHDRIQAPVFTDSIAEHGYLYMPIIKLKSAHPIFGLERQK